MRAGDARALGEVLVLDDVERRDPDRRRERIPPERAPVVARLERRHDVPRREDRRDRIDAAAERFPEDEDVGLCILVLISEAHSGPPKPGLNLVRYEQPGSFTAERAGGREISVGGDDDPAFTLDRLDQ